MRREHTFKEQPSPLGRGWTASGAFTSRRGPGEGLLGRGVVLMKSYCLRVYPGLPKSRSPSNPKN